MTVNKMDMHSDATSALSFMIIDQGFPNVAFGVSLPSEVSWSILTLRLVTFVLCTIFLLLEIHTFH